MDTFEQWWPGEQPAQIRRRVWDKAAIVPDLNEWMWRQDPYGRLMFWDDYGDRRSDYGWEIDHIFPRKNFLFAENEPDNQRALHWRSNVSRGAPKLSDVLRGW